MPRYEHGSTKFWDITLKGKQFTTTFGKIGATGQTRLKTFETPAAAKAEYDHVIAQKLKEGYALAGGKAPKVASAVVASSNPQLEAAIDADPYDTEAYSVYADFLLDAGDPRGELIALQLAGKNAAAAKLIDKHTDTLLGPIAAHAKTYDHSYEHKKGRRKAKQIRADAFTWKYGFIHGLRLTHNHYAVEYSDPKYDLKGSLADVLGAVLAHPSGRFVAEITFTFNNEPSNNLQDLIDVLAKKAPPTIRKLHFGDYKYAGGGAIEMYGNDTEISWYSIGNLGKLWKRVPGLRHLITQGGSKQSSLDGGLQLGKIDAPSLVHAEFRTGGLEKANAKAIATATMPNIEHLDVWYGDPDYGGDATIKEVQLLLQRADLPKLRHLGLMNSEHGDQLPAAVAKSGLVKQLRELDLSMGTMTDEGAKALVAHKAAFAHLERLDVTNNYLTDAGIKLVKGLAKQVDAKKQRENDDPDYRHPAVCE